jgi:hypothetical protein
VDDGGGIHPGVCNRHNLRATKADLVALFGALEDDFVPVADHWPMRPALVFRS